MTPEFYRIADIGEGFLAIMAKPVAGEWLQDDLASLVAVGVGQIISLLEVREEAELGLTEERNFCAAVGARFVSFPIPDRGIPSDLQSFAQLASQTRQAIEDGNNTVIHCRAGIGRSGMLAAGVLVANGVASEDAFRQISLARRVDVPDTQEQMDLVKLNESTFRKIT
ncbi:MAG: protein-tyrosine phosphatase family protein [Pseudomonadota bacterium]